MKYSHLLGVLTILGFTSLIGCGGKPDAAKCNADPTCRTQMAMALSQTTPAQQAAIAQYTGIPLTTPATGTATGTTLMAGGAPVTLPPASNTAVAATTLKIASAMKEVSQNPMSSYYDPKDVAEIPSASEQASLKALAAARVPASASAAQPASSGGESGDGSTVK